MSQLSKKDLDAFARRLQERRRALIAEIRQEIEIFACGPHPMLVAVARLAHEFSLPCQLSLEEYMACGLGGCAGCVVTINTPSGPAMKRVCVDGPVFDGQQVIF